MQRVLRGVPAADGVAVGFATVLRDVELSSAPVGGQSTEGERALQALALVAQDLKRWSASARRDGRDEEAEILEASSLMAVDPALRDRVADLAVDSSAEAAIRVATNEHARMLELLADPDFAARGADIRELGHRAVRLLNRSHGLSLPRRPTVVFARDVGPADVADFRHLADRLLGVAIAEGAPTSHAAILTRSLGLPFVVGLGPEALEINDGEQVYLDGNNGLVVVEPDDGVRRSAEAIPRPAVGFRRSFRSTPVVAPITLDGRRVELLCNVNSTRDVEDALIAGAQVGLLRTEVAFLDSTGWPNRDEHLAALRPMLTPLAGRRVTVRTLDFGYDKIPPFLAGSDERGLALTLGEPSALLAQLRAILAVGRQTLLRIVFPFVCTAEDFQAGRALLEVALKEAEWFGPPPEVGAMIETLEAVEDVSSLAAVADFLALGTNDLVRQAFDLEPRTGSISARSAADPQILSLVAHVLDAGRAASVPVEVCGEGAGETAVVVLLLGLGVDELSVVPGRLDLVRWVISSVSARDAEVVAQAALAAGSEDDSLRLVRELLSRSECAHEGAEGSDGLGRILS